MGCVTYGTECLVDKDSSLEKEFNFNKCWCPNVKTRKKIMDWFVFYMYSTLDCIDYILNYDHTESYSECAIYIWCIYTWLSIHVTCLPFDPKYNQYQNNKIPIWKVHEGLRDSGRRLVRPRLQKQIWKLSLKLGFSDWVSNLKITMFNCRDVPKQRWSMTKQNWCWQLQHVKIIDSLMDSSGGS